MEVSQKVCPRAGWAVLNPKRGREGGGAWEPTNCPLQRFNSGGAGAGAVHFSREFGGRSAPRSSNHHRELLLEEAWSLNRFFGGLECLRSWHVSYYPSVFLCFLLSVCYHVVMAYCFLLKLPCCASWAGGHCFLLLLSACCHCFL